MYSVREDPTTLKGDLALCFGLHKEKQTVPQVRIKAPGSG